MTVPPALAILLALAGAGAVPASAPVRVGSKGFTESVLLGEIASATLAAAGIPARHISAIGGDGYAAARQKVFFHCKRVRLVDATAERDE